MAACCGFTWLGGLAVVLLLLSGYGWRTREGADGVRGGGERGELAEVTMMNRRALDAWARWVPAVGLDAALSMRYDEEHARELGELGAR